MKSRRMFKLKEVLSALKRVSSNRPSVSHSSLIKNSLIIIILVTAFGVRLLPIRWGFYLSEFDPYFQYRITKHIIDNGLISWLSWRDYMSWYPWGRDMSKTSFPGLAFAAATLYTVLRALGVPMVAGPTLDPLLSDPLYNLCVIFPVIMGTATCLAVYFLGKDLGGGGVGILAALFLALDPSHIGRTSLGFFDDETVGIFSMMLFIIFFLRSIGAERTLRTGLLYAVASGLSLGYLCSSWGAARYPIAMTVLFVLVLLIMRRYSPRLLVSYGITFALALFIAMNVPRLGYRFLLETSIIPVYGVLLLLCVAEINRRVLTVRKKTVYVSVFVVLLAALLIFLWSRGIIKPLGAKFVSVLNPHQRTLNPLIESVAEHRPSAWGTFYYNFGMGVFFVPIGLYFAAMMATNLGIFMVIYCLTAIYFASSMIRLNIILSPAFCLLWALALIRLLKPFILFLKESPKTAVRRKRFRQTLGKEVIGAVLILMFILFTLTFVIGTDFLAGPQAQGPRVFTQAYSPTTIASSSMPIKPSTASSDWLKALIWMRENLPPSTPQNPEQPGTVVACWWDYGYWITIVANRTTLADNGTINRTQIEQIARMFMSPEDEAIKILKKYNVTHVVVFTTVHRGGYDMTWGEVGKFKWMIKIANLNESYFGQDVTVGMRAYWEWSQEGKNTTLYKMMTYGKFALGIPLIDGKGRSIQPVFLDHFKLVYPTRQKLELINGAYYALILIYEVKY